MAKHRRFSISEDDWISLYVKAAQEDAIGLWQIRKVGRDGFGFEGDNLTSFVKRSIVAMLESGLKPAIWSPLKNEWEMQKFLGDPPAIADEIVRAWICREEVADVTGIHFTSFT